ncbi:MAG: S8 family serine peptidase [Thermoanaerobaculum sp.]
MEENFDVSTTDEETCYGFAIKYFSGPTNVQLEFFNRFDGDPLVVNVPEGSLSPPADASGAVATAVLHVANWALEPYSSKGPTNGPGGALTGGSVKPDLSGYAQVSCNAYGANQCSGTSAASPHVGGAAALVLSGYPSYTGAQIRSYLESNAQDMGPGGKDNDYGYGRLRLGTPPASSCTAPGTPTGLASSKSSVVSGETFTLSWQAASLADSYELQYANNSGFSGAQTHSVSGTSTGFQVTTTSPMTAYFRVRAKRTCGATSNWSNTVQVSVSPSGGGGGGSSLYWIPVVANAPGQGSYFYSDVMVLNVGASAATVAFTYYPVGQAAVSATSAAPIPPGGQGIFRDIVGQFNKAGTKGVLKVEAPQPLRVFSRTYNKLGPGNSLGLTAGTTFGQGMEAYTLAETLSAGQSAYLVGLTQNANYRTNIAVANFGTTTAQVTVTLYSGSGAQLATYNVSLNPGELKQEDQVFVSKAGQSNLESGWAKVTVNSGSGVVAYASVLDNVATSGQKPSDPTTIPFKR